jgi:AraC-like DNA-binding protein
MITRAEAPFTRGGIKSSIHCLRQAPLKTSDTLPHLYHRHDYIELLIAKSGNAVLWINGERHPFTSGDLVIVHSEEPHAFTFDTDSNYVCVKFLPDILSSDTALAFRLRYLFPSLSHGSIKRVFSSEETSRLNVTSLADEIMTEWDEGEIGYELVIHSIIMKIMAHIMRMWEKDTCAIPFGVKPSDAIQKALVFILEKKGTVTEQEVAEACSLSTNYFSHAFKSAMGINFKDHVNRVKLKNARDLITATDTSITDIAYTAGFSSTSHFISVFKKEYGTTPKQFRKSIRSQG